MSKEEASKKKQKESPYQVFGLHILVQALKETPKELELRCPKGDNVVYGRVLGVGLERIRSVLPDTAVTASISASRFSHTVWPMADSSDLASARSRAVAVGAP